MLEASGLTELVMSVPEIVASTAEAAYATSEAGIIIAWNKGARELLGYPSTAVLGHRCCDVLAGLDVFGNAFCGPECPLRRMVARREAVHHFELDLRLASAQRLRVGVSALIVRDEGSQHFAIVHTLRPVEDHRASTSPLAARLSRREIEILRLLAEGHGTREIADELFISIATVRNHVQSILRKLEVHSRVGAVTLALRMQIV